MAEIHDFVADVLERYYRIQGASSLSRQEVFDIAGRERQHDVFLDAVKDAAWERHRLIVVLEGNEVIGLLKVQDIRKFPAVTDATQIGFLNEVLPRHGMRPFLRSTGAPRLRQRPRAI
jgi:hypothetical protein